MNSSTALWVEKYRPKKLDDVILDQETKTLLRNYITKRTVPNLAMVGSAGKGKTTIAKVLINELDASYLYVCASVENGVDVIRNKVRDFTNSVAIGGGIKIVVLDEMDFLSFDAMGSLRQIIEESSADTRFIITANYLHKIIEPIRSRCVPLNVRHNINDVIARCIQIIKAENIKADKETMTLFIERVAKEKYPDVRSIISNLERWCVSGILTPIEISEEGEIDNAVVEIFNFIKNKKPKQCREFCINNESLFSNDYEKLAGKLFDKFENNPAEQLLIADGIFRQSSCIDKEIQFYAMILKLCGNE